MHVLLVLTLVEHEVGVTPLLSAHLHHALARVAVFASEALVSKLRDVKVAHDVVVELVPFLPVLALAVADERVVVPRVRSAGVHDNSLQLELVIITSVFKRLFLNLFWCLLASLGCFLLSLGCTFAPC